MGSNDGFDRAPLRRYLRVTMRIATGRIVSGKVEIEGEPLAEGSLVTVLVREQDESFEVPSDHERELLAAIEEADYGELTDGDALIRSLRR